MKGNEWLITLSARSGLCLKSEACRRVDHAPLESKVFACMFCDRLNAERFGSIVTRIDDHDSQIVCVHCRMVRSFANDQGIDTEPAPLPPAFRLTRRRRCRLPTPMSGDLRQIRLRWRFPGDSRQNVLLV